MKRLFCVKNSAGKVQAIPNEGSFLYSETKYVESKRLAKIMRDALGGTDKGFHVSRGPDHIGTHGHKIKRMRLQPKRG